MSIGTVHSQHVLHSARHASRAYPLTTLLITELILILAYPLASVEVWGLHVLRALGLILFVVLLYTVFGRGRLTAWAFALGLPPMLLHSANLFGFLLRWDAVAAGLSIPFLLFLSVVLVRAVVSQPAVTSDTLAGAVATYMMIGITYGMIYSFLSVINPEAFVHTDRLGRVAHRADLMFFSFTTLTTVGYGNIVPAMGIAKSLAMLEAVTGVMYPAVLIGRLIGLYAGASRHSN